MAKKTSDAVLNALSKALSQVTKARDGSASATQTPVDTNNGTAARIASNLRLQLAVRGWTNPATLIPQDIDKATRVAALNAVAHDVETSFARHPGHWYMQKEARERIFATRGHEAVIRELASERPGDDADPVRKGLRIAFDLDKPPLGTLQIAELRGVENAAEWLLPTQPHMKELRDQALTHLARSERAAEIDRLTKNPLIGRRDELDKLVEFVGGPFEPRRSPSVAYIYGAGGAGKSTLLAHLEREVGGASPSPPLVIHLDFDSFELDPSNLVSLDIALLKQMASLAPDTADNARRVIDQLIEVGNALRNEVLEAGDDVGKTTSSRRAWTATQRARANISLGLESAGSTQGSARSSVLYKAFSGTDPNSIMLGARPLALVLDTVEVVTARGADAVFSLADWLRSLSDLYAARDVRVILCGRDSPSGDKQDITQAVPTSHIIHLTDLKEDDAVALLVNAGMPKADALAAAGALPGNPLILRLAAEVQRKAPQDYESIRRAHEAGKIDSSTASQYLAERVVAHLSDPVARECILAAIVLPEVSETLIRDVIIPVVHERKPSVDAKEAKRTFDALARAGWIVTRSSVGDSFTYQPELRRLVLKLLDAVEGHRTLVDEVRHRAIEWHEAQGTERDRAFALYHRLMRGENVTPILPNRMQHLARFLDDLPGDLHANVPPTTHKTSDDEWQKYLEGGARGDGQGDKLVKKGQPARALELYRGRPTARPGLPPTFVIQAVADTGEWHEGDVNTSFVIEDIRRRLPPRGKKVADRLIARAYWIVRLELLRSGGKIDRRWISFLRNLCASIQPGVFPPLVAIAEAITGERIAPDSWLGRADTLWSNGRARLVRELHFGERFKHNERLASFLVIQPDWFKRLSNARTRVRIQALPRKQERTPSTKMLREIQQDLNNLADAPIGVVRKMKLGERFTIDLGKATAADKVMLLRGQTIEAHKPLANTLADCWRQTVTKDVATPISFTQPWRAILSTLNAMPICPKELHPTVFLDFVKSGANDWFSALVEYVDRARVLPQLCAALSQLTPATDAEARLVKVASAFRVWDTAICNGLCSNWIDIPPASEIYEAPARLVSRSLTNGQHFGERTMANTRVERATQFLNQILGGTGGLESASDAKSAVEGLRPLGDVPKEYQKAAEGAATKAVEGKELSDTEAFALEAIIIPDKRPVVDIIGGDFKITHPLWVQLNTGEAKARIRAAIPSIGRIELPDHPSLPYGGTGFVVGKDLLMTNRHVAEIFCSGLGLQGLVFRPGRTAGIDFLQEVEGEEIQYLAVRSVAMIHPYWDMALLRVEGLSAQHTPLTLSLRHPEQVLGHDVAVIGYPAFDQRNDARVQDHVFGGVYNKKRLQPGKLNEPGQIKSFGKMVRAATHDSSTLGGNSGSGVVHVATGHILGLHFGGIYLKANYAVPAYELSRDQRVVDAGVNFDTGAAPDATTTANWWSGFADEAPVARPRRPSRPVEVRNNGGAVDAPPPARALGQRSTWTIPVQVTITVGGASATASTFEAVSGDEIIEKMVEPKHDTEYDTRDGYDADFLGIRVPMPTATDLDVVARLESGEHVLPYHHFSLVMQKERRLALFTAANVDYSAQAKRPQAGRPYDRHSLGGLGKNDMELWFEDPRIPSAHQLPDRFFSKDKGAFDRGHLVRRDDVAWGTSYAEVRAANGDTFHTTNCSPQIAQYNQSARGKDNWGDLENYVAAQAKTERLCVFSGPVLSEDDQTFVGVDDNGPVRIQIPSRFWKIVVAANGGELQTYAFILAQDLSDTPLEFIVDATWQRYMVTVESLERQLQGIAFPDAFIRADQAATTGGEAVRMASRVELAGDAFEMADAPHALESVVESSSSWRVAKSLLKLRAQVDATAPARKKHSDGTIGDAAHRKRSSDHNPWVVDGDTGVVTAMDITHDPANGCDATALAASIAQSRDPRVKYLIWNRKIMSATVSPWTWRPYSGSNPHTKHIHISVVSAKSQYDSEASWHL